MPELPEVETIRQGLAPLISGKTVEEISCFTEEVLVMPEPLPFKGEKIEGLSRKGKYLWIQMTHGGLLVHLRMSGKLLFEEKPEKGKHVRAILSFDDGSGLVFNDMRRFGRLSRLECPEEDKGYKNLGPDALLEPPAPEDFYRTLAGHPRLSLKGALLDQTIIAGLGNIYTDELCFRARIRPDCPCALLSPEDAERLLSEMTPLLEEAAGLGGTSFKDYVNGLGEKGSFQTRLRVYQRDGEPCDLCGTEILKTKIAGRSSRYCPVCQPEWRKRP